MQPSKIVALFFGTILGLTATLSSASITAVPQNPAPQYEYRIYAEGIRTAAPANPAPSPGAGSVKFYVNGSPVTQLAMGVGGPQEVVFTVQNTSAQTISGWISPEVGYVQADFTRTNCTQNTDNNIPTTLAPGASCDVVLYLLGGMPAGLHPDAMGFWDDNWNPIGTVAVAVTSPVFYDTVFSADSSSGVDNIYVEGSWNTGMDGTKPDGSYFALKGAAISTLFNQGNGEETVTVTLTGTVPGRLVGPDFSVTKLVPNIPVPFTLSQYASYAILLGDNDSPVPAQSAGTVTVTTGHGGSRFYNYKVFNTLAQ